jgi:hypothetical protein
MKIGDLYFAFRGDDSGLITDAQRAGDRAAKAFEAGGRSAIKLGSLLKTAFAGAAAGSFALATKGGLELEDTLTRVRAETGAAGEDWEIMADVIRRQNRRTTVSLDEIGDAIGAMRTDLGLTGAEIDRVADHLFNFSLVAKEAAGDTVRGVDDIVDAYSVDLPRAMRVLDQLIVSHQRWGGSITENRSALVEMAPSLAALKADLNDGIALLNLAAASGLDATTVVRALRTAVGQLKMPRSLAEITAAHRKQRDAAKRAKEVTADLVAELKKFVVPTQLARYSAEAARIADPVKRAAYWQKVYNREVEAFEAAPLDRWIAMLAAVEDPTQRAALAVEIFGAKAGGALANAIKPGISSLDEFAVSADEAAGASDRAAAQIDSSFSRRLALLGEKIGGILAEIGAAGGPVLSAAGSLGSLIGGAVSAGVISSSALAGLGASLAGIISAAAPLVVGAVAVAIGVGLALLINELFPGLAQEMHDNFWRGVEAVKGFVDDIVREVGTIPSRVGGAFNDLVDRFRRAAADAAKAFIDGIAGIPARAGQVLGGVGDFIGGLVPKFQEGTRFAPEGLAWLHEGEMVIPAAEAEAVRAGRAVIGAPVGAAGTTVGAINIYNPAPEPASRSVRRELQLLAVGLA